MFETPWIWWLLLAVVLLIIEIFAPSAILMWFALGALVAMVAALIPGLDSLAVQLAVFAAASLAGLFILRPYVKARSADAGDGREVNDFAEHLVGASGVIVDAIEGGKGRARIGDTTWTVTGPDLPKKARIRVTSVEGTRLGVKADDAY